MTMSTENKNVDSPGDSGMKKSGNKTKQVSAVCVYDFTAKMADWKKLDVISILKDECKKWCFKGEKANSGYEHWQGRISLKVADRLAPMIAKFKSKHNVDWHWSLTSKENKSNNFYIEKSETQITDVFSDTDEELYIPRQIREIPDLYPWQKTIIEISKVWDTRTINIIYCPNGNIGKTTLIGYIRAHKIGRVLPCCFEYKEIMQIVCDLPTSTSYFIDMPRAIKKNQLEGFFGGLETTKDGYAYDLRYRFQEKVFDCPNIFVFTNSMPSYDYLSKDRWKYWIINVNRELETFTPPDSETADKINTCLIDQGIHEDD